MFEKICFFWRKFSKDTPLQNDDEILIGIPPPSKTQKVFEGGVSLVNPADIAAKMWQKHDLHLIYSYSDLKK